MGGDLTRGDGTAQTLFFDEDEEREDLGARYEDLGVLGEGGMGEVRRVWDRDLNRKLAMKIAKPALMRKPKMLARFLEEAQVGAQLQALVPRPRANLIRYHGVFAANARLRPAVVPEVEQQVDEGDEAALEGVQTAQPKRRRHWIVWAELLRRVFSQDLTTCPRCEGRCASSLPVIGSIEATGQSRGQDGERPSSVTDRQARGLDIMDPVSVGADGREVARG